jgi:hypothetical protein
MPPHPQPAARVGGQAPAHQRQITTSKQDTSTRQERVRELPHIGRMSVLEYIVGRLQEKPFGIAIRAVSMKECTR